MAKLLIRHDGGGAATLGVHRVGDVLYGGPADPEWRKLDATLVPYASKVSGGIPNVAVGLDTALALARELENRLSSVEALSKEADRGHDQIIAEVQTQMGEMSRHVSQTASGLAASIHPAIRVSRISNPALHLDAVRQELKLDLAAAGSYSDMKTQMGATSIQGAIETVHSVTKALSDRITVLQEQIAQLNAELNMLRKAQN